MITQLLSLNQPSVSPAQEAPRWWLGMEMSTNGLWKCLSLSSLPCLCTACFDGSTFKAPLLTLLRDVLCGWLRQPQRLLSHHTRLCFPSVPVQLQLAFMLTTLTAPKKPVWGLSSSAVRQSMLLRYCWWADPGSGDAIPPGWHRRQKASALSARGSPWGHSQGVTHPLLYVGPCKVPAGSDSFHLSVGCQESRQAQTRHQTSPWLEGEEVGFALP